MIQYNITTELIQKYKYIVHSTESAAACAVSASTELLPVTGLHTHHIVLPGTDSSDRQPD